MKRLLPAVLVGLLLALAPGSARAQGFGKSKVQYDVLDWAVLETPHTRLHFYAEEESLARRITAFAESVCVEYDGRFRLTPRHHIPILLYSTHHLFQQTNAAQGLISEGTGGLTELIKGRVLVPHNGSWARLRWVMRHELAHAYMLEKLAVVMREHHRTQNYMPPLWFIEGLAEYCGTVWDSDGEGLLRDAILTGEAYPLTRSEPITGTVLMYKEGQSFLLWLDQRYGPGKVFDLMDQWWRAEDFETAFRLVFGRTVKELDGEWFEAERRRYFPVVATANEVSEVAHRLTPHGEYHLGPRAMPGGSADSTLRFCWFEASESGVDLMLSEPHRGRRRVRHLLHSGQSPAFESFHLFQNRAAVSSSGLIAVTAKSGGCDALTVLDPSTGRRLRRLDAPTLVTMHDPAWMPGDSAVVFSGQDYSGRADLYRARWPGGKPRLERLTNDDFDDLEPDVSPDGRWVAFASDRGSPEGLYSIYRLSLAGGAPPERISFCRRGEDRQPVYSPDGRRIAFRSTRDGTSDLWVRSAEPDSVARRVTRLWGPALDPDWLWDGSGLLFTGEQGIRFRSYAIRFDPDTLPAELEIALPPAPHVPQIAETRHTDPTRAYERRLGFDLVQNAVAFDPVLGTGGSGQLALSDVLGNEQLLITLTNDSQRFGNFWDGFEGGATYLNQGRRLNYGLGAFRLTETYDADLDVVRRERRIGVTALAFYPFSKFTRVQASVVARHVSDHLLRDGRMRSVDMVSNFLTWSHDDTRWNYGGPSRGVRTFLTAGYTRDLADGGANFGTLLGELRTYLPTVPGVTWASRVQGQSSNGPDAQRFYMGGRGSIRGYERRTLSGLQTALVQSEVRFPLLRGLVLAVPAPWMFPTITGAAFADAAWAWNAQQSDNAFNLLRGLPGSNLYFGTATGSVAPITLGSAGFSVWVGGGFFPAFRWNYAWLTRDFSRFTRRPRTQFTIDFNY